MKYFTNIPYIKNLLLDVFGIGEAVSGAAGIASTALTNKANKEIADKTNETNLKIHEDDRTFNAEEAEKARQFNAEEAEKARQFNAEEAEKARQWSSESAVVKRRAEAGLNTAITGQTSSTPPPSASGPSASGPSASAPSAPNLVTPTMQTAPVADLVNAVTNMAKAESEIYKNDSSAKQSLADAKHKGELAEYQKIVNEWTPDTCRATLDELRSKTRLNKAEKELLRGQLEGVQMQLDKYFMEGVCLYYQTMAEIGDVNNQANFFLAKLEVDHAQLQQDAAKFEAEWLKHGFDLSYHFGKYEKKDKGWNVGGDASLSRGRSGSTKETNTNTTNMPDRTSSPGNVLIDAVSNAFETATSKLISGGAGINGGYRDSQFSEQTFRNQELYDQFVELQGCINISKSPKYSKAQQDAALQRINYIIFSAESYNFFVRQMGKYKDMPSNFKQTQDFEDQQF